MPLTVSIGSAQALNGREAGLQAAHQALNKIGSAVPSLGFIIASHHYQARDVVGGASGLLGDTPMIGFSSPAGLTSEGVRPNSVVMALLSGDLAPFCSPPQATTGHACHAVRIAHYSNSRSQPPQRLQFHSPISSGTV